MEQYVYLTQEIKDSFDTEITIEALVLNVKSINTFLKTFLTQVFPQTKPIEIPNDKTMVLINLLYLKKLIPLVEKQSEELKKYIEENNLKTQPYKLKKTYSDYNYNEVLKKYLPVDPPQGYETIGNIAHFNLKPEHNPYKFLIGQVLLDKTKHLKTVVNKTQVIRLCYVIFKREKLHNVYRTPTLELLAGDKSYEATVQEGGCKFLLDFEKVYWCTRLYSERTRVIEFIKKNLKQNEKLIILDLFCGIGPFAIRCAKQLNALCIANDLNPECYKYLKLNIENNKLSKTVIPLNMDAREVVKLFYGDSSKLEEKGIPKEFATFTHVYMNLPVLAMDFLDVFQGYLTQRKNFPLPMIHVYGFIKGETNDDLLKAIEERIGKVLPGFKKELIESFQIVKNVTAKKKMVCCTFKLDERSATLEENQFFIQGQANTSDMEDEDAGEFVDDCQKKIKQ